MVDMQNALEHGWFLITHNMWDQWLENNDPRVDIYFRNEYARKVQQNGIEGTCTPLQEPPTSR